MSFIYGTVVKIPPASAGDMGSIPELRRFPWRRKWQPASAFLIPWTEEPGRLLVDYIHSVANNLTCQNQSMHLYNCNYTCSWFPMKGIWKLDEQILHNKEEDIKMGRRNKDTTLPIKSHIPHPKILHRRDKSPQTSGLEDQQGIVSEVKSLNRVWLSATPWIAVPGSSVRRIFQARVLE